MRLSAAARYVLDLCTEDYTPLFDVFAVIHAQHGGSEAECLAQSRLLVEGFLRAGLAAVYYDDLGASTGRQRVASRVPEAMVVAELARDENWLPRLRPKPDLFQVSIAATPGAELALWGK